MLIAALLMVVFSRVLSVDVSENMNRQGQQTSNSTMISYGAEGMSSDGRQHEFYLVNNTLMNDLQSGNFLYINSQVSDSRVINNINKIVFINAVHILF